MQCIQHPFLTSKDEMRMPTTQKKRNTTKRNPKHVFTSQTDDLR